MPPHPTADTLHLEKRHQTWFCVVYVPRPLRSVLGAKKLSRSLRTHDLAEARRLRHAVVAEFKGRIASAKAPAGSEDAATLIDRAMQDRALDWDEDSYSLVDVAESIEDRHGPEAARAYYRVASGQSTPLLHFVDVWLAQSDYPARSQVQHRGTLAELERWCRAKGIAVDVAAITRKVAGDFIGDAVVAGAARATINRKLSTLRAYWSWMVDRGHHIGNSPWAGQQVAKGRRNTGQDPDGRPFTPDEVARLLAGDADQTLRDFILLGALTGARIESLANLRVADCQDGICHIRHDKTAAGVRRFPFHSGLSELIERRTKGKQAADWLFPELTTTKTGSRSAAVVKRFKTYRVGLKIDERAEGRRASLVTFHSLRHFFITQAIQAEQPEHVVQQVVGHKRQGITLGVYHGGDTLERLGACVESVRLLGAPSGS